MKKSNLDWNALNQVEPLTFYILSKSVRVKVVQVLSFYISLFRCWSKTPTDVAGKKRHLSPIVRKINPYEIESLYVIHNRCLQSGRLFRNHNLSILQIVLFRFKSFDGNRPMIIISRSLWEEKKLRPLFWNFHRRETADYGLECAFAFMYISTSFMWSVY